MREGCRKQSPARTLRLSFRQTFVRQVLNFAYAGSIDFRWPASDLAIKIEPMQIYVDGKSGRFPASPMRASAGVSQPTLWNVNVRPFADLALWASPKDVATAMLTTLSGSSQSAPTYWLNPTNGGLLSVSVQNPAARYQHHDRSAKHPVHQRRRQYQLLAAGAGAADQQQTQSCRTTTSSPLIDIFCEPRRDATRVRWRPTFKR